MIANVDPNNLDGLHIDGGVQALVVAIIVLFVLFFIAGVYIICKMVQAGNQMLDSISRFIHRNDYR